MQSEEGVERFPDRRFITHTRPGVEHLVVGRDQERHRLIRNTVQPENLRLVVQSPVDLARLQEIRSLGGRVLVRPFPGDRYEGDVVAVVPGYLIDDGQLPSTGWSPLRPEHQVHRPGFLTEGERAGLVEIDREIGGGRTVEVGRDGSGRWLLGGVGSGGTGGVRR